MKLHDLAPPKGSTKAKHRVGRGTGGKGHKTAGRGTKGQNARGQVKAGFEGGQLPLMQRIPKLKGFKNPFRVEYVPVNIGALAELGGSAFTLESMVGRRAVQGQRTGQGAGPGHTGPGHHGLGPRLLRLGRSGHHGRRWQRGADPAALRGWASCRVGQRSHEPVATAPGLD